MGEDLAWEPGEHAHSPSPGSFPYLSTIIPNCFHLQFQNSLLSDTSVGHLMYVFSFPFLRKKPVTWTQPAASASDKRAESLRPGRCVAQRFKRGGGRKGNPGSRSQRSAPLCHLQRPLRGLGQAETMSQMRGTLLLVSRHGCEALLSAAEHKGP